MDNTEKSVSLKKIEKNPTLKTERNKTGKKWNSSS